LVEEDTAPISLDEYRVLRGAGQELPDREYSDERLLHLLAFASDALRAADSIREDASSLRDRLLAIFYEEHEPARDRDPAGWRAYRGRIGEWHRTCLAENGYKRRRLAAPSFNIGPEHWAGKHPTVGSSTPPRPEWDRCCASRHLHLD
jgi:hypothetical protein